MTNIALKPRGRKANNNIGSRYGHLLVVQRSGSKNRKAVWECVCDCGKTVFVTSSHLETGNTKSCGCFKRELVSLQKTTHGHARQGAKTVEYNVWADIIKRCKNSNSKNYHNYGGRGIKVCDRWLSYENFFADMGLRPSSKHSIERKEVNGDYEPSNCCWATRQEQQRNTRRTRLVEFDSQVKSLVEWTEEKDLPYPAVYSRLMHGWTPEEALTTPIGSKRMKQAVEVAS